MLKKIALASALCGFASFASAGGLDPVDAGPVVVEPGPASSGKGPLVGLLGILLIGGIIASTSGT